MFRVGLDQGHDSIILGAWGCGAFKNPVDVMASLFKEVSEEERASLVYGATLYLNFRGKVMYFFDPETEKSLID